MSGTYLAQICIGMRRRTLALVAVVVLAAGAIGVLVWLASSPSFIRDRAVAAVNARFASQVELGSLQIGVFPLPNAEGSGIRLRHNGRTDVAPLISVRAFDASASLYGLFATPFHLRRVTLDQLEIRLPPGGLKAAPPQNNTAVSRSASAGGASAAVGAIIIDEIVSRSARLEIASSRPGRLPRVFEINDLRMTDFGQSGGGAFHAGLINPVPRGRIETSGVFGPWDAGEPRQTPVRGEYAFKDANLDAIKGLGGTLSSVGRYQGVLQRIEVDGQTETPDFAIDIAGQPVSLRTRFEAVVDGTNGDTFLENVEARLRESTILAKGAVVRTEEERGRHVTLDVRVVEGRIEDLLALAVKAASPPLTGRIDVETTLVLPAGQQDVVERLQLDGRFSLAQARFTNIDVQQRIATLSRRARGNEEDATRGESVVSNVSGRFALKNSRLTFSELAFSVPGATVQLSGTYDLRSEQMAFGGDLLLDASLPDTLSGFKSLLARAVQPFFRRPGGGSKLPIRIAGPRTKPAFGLDVRRAFWFD